MAGHTPGPWAYTERDRPGRKITLKRRHWEVGSLALEAGRTGVAIVFGDDRANARLTAAAPDLLQACHECLEFLGQNAGDETVESRLGLIGGFYVAQRLRDAIAKATTQPQPATT
jgi:hypothetical protein